MSVSREQVAALVLIGGKSVRMGRDKATVMVGDEPLWSIAVRTLEPIVNATILVGANSDYFEPKQYRLISDDPPGLGPLGGIATGLEQSGYEHHLVLAVDYPLVKVSLLEALLAKAGEYQAACGRSVEFLEPLIGYYHASCASAIRAMIADNEIRTHKLFERVKSCVLSREEYDLADPERHSQINVNTPADLTWARELFGGATQ